MHSAGKHRTPYSSLFTIFFLWVLSFFFLSSSSKAQLVDTIRYSLKTKPKFYLTLASFNTFIDGDFASFNGIRTGISFNNRIRFGAGYYNLANNAVISEIVINDPIPFVTNGELQLKYIAVSAEYLIYRNYPWQITVIPFQPGFGWAHYDYISRAPKERTSTPKEIIIICQPEVGFQYNVLKWLSGGVTAGYRFNLYRSKEQSKNLSSPTFALDIRISVDQLIKMIFSGSESVEE